ncbi:MAG: NADH-quinone oxidoreductase subunit J [Dehalococcoidia bacterium]|nr:MAG: NADH-quinone oxidoreductase subunit J [Dehalococcoidia bacterium]
MSDPGSVIAFWTLALLAVVAGVGVVGSRNLFHSAIFLVVVFLAVAGLYLLLAADFLFGVQIMVYAGAIAVLIVFAVMLTQQIQSGNQESRQWLAALALAVALGIVMTAVLAPGVFPASRLLPPLPETNTVLLAQALFNPYVLPFEIASVILLVAMVGAIVLAREDRG